MIEKVMDNYIAYYKESPKEKILVKMDMTKGKTLYIHDGILAYLIQKGVLFLFEGDNGFIPSVNMSDTFGYCCADSEDITSFEELEEVFEAYEKDSVYGTTYWVAKRRNCKPIVEWLEPMVALGYDFTGMSPSIEEEEQGGSK